MKTECKNESWRRKKAEDHAEDKREEKTLNWANLDSCYNCHHENSSLVNMHALTKESIKIMTTHCITT